MATANAASTLDRASDWGSSFASSTLTILAGATSLAVHTVPSFTASNSGSNGLATAATIADDTILASATADSATLTEGTKTYTLTVGLVGSGADLELSTLTYVTGETSTISSLVVTFPA